MGELHRGGVVGGQATDRLGTRGRLGFLFQWPTLVTLLMFAP